MRRYGHRDHAHPREDGQYVCSRTLNGMPSCRECSARFLALRVGPFGGMAEALRNVRIEMPSVSFLPGGSMMPSGWEGATPNLVMAVRAQDRSLRRS